jgi:hypothetical protein
VAALYILGCRKPLASQVRIRCGWTMGETGTALAGNTGGGGQVGRPVVRRV